MRALRLLMQAIGALSLSGLDAADPDMQALKEIYIRLEKRFRIEADED